MASSPTVPVKLGYWKIRGLGQPCRLLLEMSGLPYTEKYYEEVQRPDGSWDESCWFNEKFSLGAILFYKLQRASEHDATS